MPVVINTPVRRLDQREFGEISFEAMRHVFSIHNDLGRLFDEKIYKCELANRMPNVQLEVPVDVSFDSFRIRLFIDVLVGFGGLFEFKAVESLTGAHRAQLLQYLMLADLSHGKLINVRQDRVQHEFVNSHWQREDRIRFEIESTRWDSALPKLRLLQDYLTALLRDLGTGLGIGLYEEAIVHVLGGIENVESSIQIVRAGRVLGRQPVRLIAPGIMLKVTGFQNPPDGFDLHLQRMLAHTELKAIAWMNISMTKVTFATVVR